MKRFEEVTISIIMGIMVMVSSLIGTYTILYDVVDLYGDQAGFGTLIVAPVVIYWVIKSIIIRLKRK